MNWNDKHRPKSFRDFIGNRETLTAIEGFILSGDIPHLCFFGDTGTGKTALAELTANKILGEENLANFIELNASDEREEKDIKKRVIRAIKHIPIGSLSKRVILFDEADGLKPTAQDLLKRPVEKSKNTLFIFTCNDIGGLIKPIKSRCALFEFKPLTDSDIVE